MLTVAIVQIRNKLICNEMERAQFFWEVLLAALFYINTGICQFDIVCSVHRVAMRI